MSFNINYVEPKHMRISINNVWKRIKKLYYNGVLVWAERISKEIFDLFPIIIEDSYEEHNLLAYEIEGANKQKVYNGNQLIPYPHRSSQRIINGVTFTSNSDGSITIDGTATSDADYYIYGNWANRNNTLFSNMSQITLSIKGDGIVKLVVYTFGNEGMRGTSTVNSTVFNLGSHDGCCIYIHVDSGLIFDDFVIHPMINVGSIALEREPYVGAKPSPSFDFPQEIKYVGNKVDEEYVIPIEISGRNMFNKNSISNGFYISDTDGYLNYDENQFTSEYILVGKHLNINCSVYNEDDVFRYAFYDEEYIPITVGLGLYSTENTVGILNNAKYVRISAPLTYLNHLQIEDDEHPNGYVPYIQPIVTNITLSEPLRAIGDYRDSIIGGLEQSVDGTYYMVGEIERKIRHLELAVSDMNNLENWAGWKNISVVREDYFNVDHYFSEDEIICNFSLPMDNLIGVNTLDGNATVFLIKSTTNLSQTDWKTKYPNLVMDINYVKDIPSTESISLPLVDIPKGYVKIKLLTDVNTYGKINYYGMA